jgi:hypothetical protein
MKSSVKIAIVCSLLSIGFTLAFYFAGKSQEGYEAGPFINLFLLLTAISGGVFSVKKKENFRDRSFLEDIKYAMQGGIMFTIFVSLFVYYYHSSMDTSIIDSKVTGLMEMSDQNVPDEATYKELQKNDNTWQDKTFMDYKENQEDQFRSMVSAEAFALVHVLIGMLLTLFFSIFVTLILRKVVLRQ